ncbi:MAG: AGCS family alanine or glycine:cation symporter, partial [Colwellia sp.]
VAQGYVQMLGVFLDTMVLCSCTAVIILLSDIHISGDMEGIRMTQNAMTSHFGAGGNYFVAAAITLFAFTSVVANYAYAESNLHMFKLDHKIGRLLYSSIYLLMVFWGANASLKEVWGLADMALGLMTLVNIYAIILLTPTVLNLTKDFHRKLKANVEPSFSIGDVKIQGETEPGIWSNNR